MRRAVSIVCVLILALSLFACGTNTTTNPSASPSPSTAPASASSAASPSPSVAASPSPMASVTYSGDLVLTDYVSPPDPNAKTGGVLKVVNVAEGASPIGIPWSNANLEGLLMAPLYESLVFSKVNGDIIPVLATEWKTDPATASITLKIRPNVKFTDGTPLTAEVAGWNIMKQVEAKTVQNITGYEAIDDLTLVVKYTVLTSTSVSSLASLGMISKEAYEKNGEEWAKENPVGCGPFMLKEYLHGQKLILVKNPNYWQAGKPYLDGVEFHFIRDNTTASMALQSTGADAIDVQNLNSAEQVSMYKALNQFQIIIQPTGPVSLYPSSIVEGSPLAIKEVRQAISFAIDRESIVAARGFGICTPGDQPVPAGSLAQLPDSYNTSFNVEKAKELLTKAGFANGFTTTLFCQPGVADKDVAVAVQKMLADVGITAELQFPDAGGYSKIRSTGWEGLILGGFRAFSNPYTTFYLYFDKAQTFMVSVARPDGWAEALDAALAAPAPDAKLLQECNKLLVDNATVIPVYNMTDNWTIKLNVHGGGYGEYDRCTLANAWKE